MYVCLRVSACLCLYVCARVCRYVRAGMYMHTLAPSTLSWFSEKVLLERRSKKNRDRQHRWQMSKLMHSSGYIFSAQLGFWVYFWPFCILHPGCLQEEAHGRHHEGSCFRSGGFVAHALNCHFYCTSSLAYIVIWSCGADWGSKICIFSLVFLSHASSREILFVCVCVCVCVFSELTWWCVTCRILTVTGSKSSRREDMTLRLLLTGWRTSRWLRQLPWRLLSRDVIQPELPSIFI